MNKLKVKPPSERTLKAADWLRAEKNRVYLKF
jgi:hypothetical protein